MSTKVRHPPTTPKTLATPRRKGTTTKQTQQAVLENFDVEIKHRTGEMRRDLETALNDFMTLADADIVRIPRNMLNMTIGDLEACWAGSFQATGLSLAKKQFVSVHPERDEADLVAAAKRKRVQSPGATPAPRSIKNPRKATTTPAGKRRTTTKRTKAILPASTSMSTLPQDHVFNPQLPETPRLPRPARRNESFFSANGSPVDLGGDSSDDSGSESGSDSDGPGSDDDDDARSDASDELPDPEAMERRALARSASHKSNKSGKSAKSTKSARSAKAKNTSSRAAKTKRAPSLLFRQGLGAGGDDDEHDEHAHAPGAVHIPLSDGRVITFDPARIEAGRIDAELAQGGLSDAEKRTVKARVQEEVVRALTARVAEWNALKD